MLKVVENTSSGERTPITPTLDQLAREGARRMLAEALEAEVAAYIEAHRDARDDRGGALVVRNGHAATRAVTTGAGRLEVATPRVNDKRVVDGACTGPSRSPIPAHADHPFRRMPITDSGMPIIPPTWGDRHPRPALQR
jgi:hypothetical protein